MKQVLKQWAIVVLIAIAATAAPRVNAQSLGEIDGAEAGEGSSLTVATFAGGCFWCVEHAFEQVPGVKAALNGYTGGEKPYPSYDEVITDETGHVEVVRVIYDAREMTYEGLLQVYWRTIDPTDAGGQFIDRGRYYRPMILYHTPEQKVLAEQSRDDLARSGRYDKPIVVEIVPAGRFYRAETYHQDFRKKNLDLITEHNLGADRRAYLRAVWGDELELDFEAFRPGE